jgi:hypothetical protein
MDQNFILPLPFQLRNYQEIKSVKNYQAREKYILSGVLGKIYKGIEDFMLLQDLTRLLRSLFFPLF